MIPITANKIIIKLGKKDELREVPSGIVANIDKIKKTYATTPITGVITAIKLAVVPSFLPDSSDILNL
jgi:hypothetical protein